MTRTLVQKALITLLLCYHHGIVRAGLFCPPYVKDANYDIYLEIYGLSEKCIQSSLAAININGTHLMDYDNKGCAFSNSTAINTYGTHSADFSSTIDCSQPIILGNNSGLQYRMTWNVGVAMEMGIYEANWTCGDQNIWHVCEVSNKAKVNECDVYSPCVNSDRCDDMDVGYFCSCKRGYSGMNCSEGDQKLYCFPNIFNFLAYGKACSEISNVDCYLAGANLTSRLTLSYEEDFIDIHYNSTNLTIFFSVCFSSSASPDYYLFSGNVSADSGEKSTIQFNLTLKSIFLNVPKSNYYYFDVPENKPVGSEILSVNRSCCQDTCIWIVDNMNIEKVKFSTDLGHGTIQFNSSGQFFYVASKLAAPLLITSKLQANVGAYDYGSVTVIFNVTDVDDPPICDSLILMIPTIILPIANTNLTKINCSDPDLEPQFRTVNYTIDSSSADLFKVTEDNVIQVTDSIWNLTSGNYSFNITLNNGQVYGRNPIVIQAFFRVIVPTPACSLDVLGKEPSYWDVNSSVVIQVTCQTYHVYSLAISDVSITPNGFFIYEFFKQNSSISLLDMNIAKFEPNIYNVTVNISLGNSAVSKTLLLKIYNPPNIGPTDIIYVFESQKKGEAIHTFGIQDSSFKEKLDFSLTDGNKNSLFTLSQNGTLYLSNDLSNASTDVYILTFEVKSEISQLKSLKNTTIQLLPACNLTNLDTVYKEVRGSVKCLGSVKFLLFPNITAQEPDKYNLTVHNQTILVTPLFRESYVLGNEFFFNATVSYKTYRVNVSLVLLNDCIENYCHLCNDEMEPFMTQLLNIDMILCDLSTSTSTTFNMTPSMTWPTSPDNSTSATLTSSASVPTADSTMMSMSSTLVSVTQTKTLVVTSTPVTYNNTTVVTMILCFYNNNITANVKRTSKKDEEIYTFICKVNDADYSDQIIYNLNNVEPSSVTLTVKDKTIVLSIELPMDVNEFSANISAQLNGVTRILFVTFIVQDKACKQEISALPSVVFKTTKAGQTAVSPCPPFYTGEISRFCTVDERWEDPVVNCTRPVFTEALKAAKNVSSSAEVKDIVNRVKLSLEKNRKMIGQDISNIISIIGVVGQGLAKYNLIVNVDTLQEILNITDNLESPNSSELAFLLVESLEQWAFSSLKSIHENKTIQTSSIVIKLQVLSEKVDFDSSKENGWLKESVNKISLVDKDNGLLNYSVIMHRNLGKNLKVNESLQENYNENQELKNKTVNSYIISLKVLGTGISTPVNLTFSYLNNNLSDPVCGFLNTTVSGLWSTQGCSVQSVTKNQVLCSCNHLTNFAILMNQFSEIENSIAIDIISKVGCGISLFCLTLTVITYLVLWKYLKNDRSILHINLSICLIIGYIVFLAGIDKTDDEVGCIVVAALLHFFFLAVFFMMLAEGIEIVKSVSFVFTSKSIIKYLLLGAYGIPFIIVAISLGITQTNGYGNDKFCWLSVENGLLWAFVGPVLFVFLINFIILILVIRTMQKSQIIRDRSFPDRIKSALRSICILSPILGLAWIFGILSVNNDAVVFQYLFAIFNSLQGLFIFIFQCLLQHQVRDGLKEKKRKYQARTSLSGQNLVSNSSSVRASTESHCLTRSKSNTITQSSSEGTYDFPLFPNAVYKDKKRKSVHEETFSNISNEGFHSKQGLREISNFTMDLQMHNGSVSKQSHNFHSSGSPVGLSFQNPGFILNDEYDFNKTSDKERVKHVYGNVQTTRQLSSTSSSTSTSDLKTKKLKAKARWKKAQNLTKASKKNETALSNELSNIHLSDDSKPYKTKKSRPQLPPLIIPRPTSVFGTVSDHHSNI